MKTRRLVRCIGILLLIAVLTPSTAILILYTPLTSRVATRWVSAWLTKHSGVEIDVEQVKLLFPLRVEVEGLRVGEQLHVERFSANIRLRPLRQGVVKADYAGFRGIHIHTGTLTDIAIDRLRVDNFVYDWYEREGCAHRILLDEGDISLHESPTPHTPSNENIRLPLTLNVSHTVLRHIRVGYIGPQMEVNAVVDCTTLHNIIADTTMHMTLTSADIEEGMLTIAQSGKESWILTNLTIHADSLYYYPGAFTGQIQKLTFQEVHGLTLQEGAMNLAWKDGTLSLPSIVLRTTHSTLEGQLHTKIHSKEDVAFEGACTLHLGYNDARLLVEWIDSIPRAVVDLYPMETLFASIAVEGTIEQWRLIHCHVSLPTLIDLDVEGSMQAIAHSHQSRAQCSFEAKTYDLHFLTALTRDSTLHLPSGIVYQGILCYTPDTLHAICSFTLSNGKAIVEASYNHTSGAYTLQVQTDSFDLRPILPNSSLGIISLQTLLAGNSTDYWNSDTHIRGTLHLQRLQWNEYTFSNASAQIILDDRTLYTHVTYNDSLMQWNQTGTVQYSLDAIKATFQTHLNSLNLQALHLSDTDIRPRLQCHTTLSIDSGKVYNLWSHFTDLTLTTPTQHIEPRPITLQAMVTPDTAQLSILSGDLTFTAGAEGMCGEQSKGIIRYSTNLPDLHATLTAGNDNPISNYLTLLGVKAESLVLTARYIEGTLHAHLQSGMLSWRTTQMHLQGKAEVSMAWKGELAPDSLTGMLYLTEVQYALPSYNLAIHNKEALPISFTRRELTLSSIHLYTVDKQPLLLEGSVMLQQRTPTVHLHLTAHGTNLLQSQATRESLLYGKALVSGGITLDGPLNELSLDGNLRVLPSSSLHYIYKDAILTTSNQLDQVVTFVSFSREDASPTQQKSRIATRSLTANISITIDPTAQLEVSLGANQQNEIKLQGGGMLTLQYIPPMGLRLSGKYLIETGHMTLNVPLLHVSNMTLRQGSSITWSGNPLNPLLNIEAEERIRSSVTLDGSPQSVLFVAGVSFSETLERLNIQFTLSAPENAPMQNTLATLSPEERGKLSVALLTTGLYLGEGGTGNIMNTALKSILQSQLDNISRDAFRTVDVSIGIEPLTDGVSGVSTRTDYSFNLAKRLWNDRIRLIIGGRVTTSGERIEDNAVIDNISIEWRISSLGNQYLRFFYDTHYESILEGEIRETGVGYVYRRRF